ncbi:MAG: DUF5916 domain-containing protein, partial [Salinibacter sp.]
FFFFTDGYRSLSFGLDGDKVFGGYDLFETRGLWPRQGPRTISGEFSISTDTRRSWQLKAKGRSTFRSDGGTKWQTTLKGQWNIGSRLKLSGKVSYQIERGVVEWAANETFARQPNGQWAIGRESDPPSDLSEDDFRTLQSGHDRLSTILSGLSPVQGANQYYVPVYGARDTERLNLTLRSNLALTRHLSFEFFGQLFAARGRYQDFRILRTPDEMRAFSAYPRRHDFATSSFLTNAVLRWQFRPGSELFLVWSQNRRLPHEDPFFYDQRRTSPYNQSTVDRLTDAFNDFPRNAFILKLQYTFY